jgi:hypothetical protein
MNDMESSLDDPYPMDELEKDLKRAKGPRRAPWLLGGLVLGIAGTLLLPPLLRPYLPDSFRGEVEMVTGPILGEERDGDRLLLTIQAEQGALLATFTERVAEIDLLVGVGDTVSLGVSRYQPFVENPTFEGVKKVGAVSGASESESPDVAGDATEPSGSADPEGSEDSEPQVTEPAAGADTAATTGDTGDGN